MFHYILLFHLQSFRASSGPYLYRLTRSDLDIWIGLGHLCFIRVMPPLHICVPSDIFSLHADISICDMMFFKIVTCQGFSVARSVVASITCKIMYNMITKTKKNTLLRVIPTMTFIDLLLANLLAFYLAYPLAFYLAYFLANVLAYTSWHSIRHIF